MSMIGHRSDLCADASALCAAGLMLAHYYLCRWVYRNPFSILDPNAVDTGMGSKNGTVNSVLSRVPRTYQPRLRYCHMATMSHLPNGSIAAQWQVCCCHDTLSAPEQWDAAVGLRGLIVQDTRSFALPAVITHNIA